MIHPSMRAGWSAWVLASALWFAQGACAAQPDAGPTIDVYALVEEGRQALLAEKYTEASKFFEQAMAKPAFAVVDPDLQYFAFLLASYAAEGAGDKLGAHEFTVVATRFSKADGKMWVRRAGVAASVENWEDASFALTATAKKWPKEIKGDEYHAWLVSKTVREIGKNPQLRQQRFDLLNALFDGGYKLQYDTEPSYQWLVLATESLERKDLKRAREVTRRITDSTVLVAMRIDRRFDALTAENPKLFDVMAAAEKEARRLKKAVTDHPKELNPVMQYGYALLELGRFDESLSLADDVIARVEKAPANQPPYTDVDDNLNWIYNHKASALRALGKWDEAAAVLASWERNDRNRDDKASQAINLGFFYNEMGRPEDALKAVDGIDWGSGMSDYGRTQYQFVRFQAYQQLGKDQQVQEIVNWMREHQDDAPDTAQSTMLEAGDAEGAAALLLSRLRDTDKRASALAEIQTYAPTPRTERQKKIDALQESLLTRADVATGISQYGRREKFAIYSLEY